MDVHSYREHQQVLNRQQIYNNGLPFPNPPESHCHSAGKAHNWIEQDHIPDRQQAESSVLLQSEARPLAPKSGVSPAPAPVVKKETSFLFTYISFNLGTWSLDENFEK
jgi:hypothetical protein